MKVKRRRSRRKAFSLIEALVVTSLVLALSCTLLLGSAGNRSAKDAAAEADRLSLWLSSRMSRAQAEGCGFWIRLSERNPGGMEMRLYWFDGTGKEEIFRSESARLQAEVLPRLFIYSSEWHTMTPAVTMSLSQISGTDGAKTLVSVSGQGFVKVSRVP